MVFIWSKEKIICIILVLFTLKCTPSLESSFELDCSGIRDPLRYHRCRRHQSYRKRECYPLCKNAICYYSECLCNIGFKKVNHSDHECIKGFSYNSHCDPPCQKGLRCRSGNCVCSFPYELKDGLCTPTCSKLCKNGICVAPETCECNANYTKSSKDRFRCDPICKLECIYGKCTAPNYCTCNDGYERSNGPIRWNVCVPTCNMTCVNGYCSAPNACTCRKGYKKSSTNATLCEPICESSCMHGTCAKPNFCNCDPGMVKTKHNICKPVCNNTTQDYCSFVYTHMFRKSIKRVAHHEFVFHRDKPFFIHNAICSEVIKNVSSPYSCYTQFNQTSHTIQAFCSPQTTPLPANVSANVTSGHQGLNFNFNIIIEGKRSSLRESSIGCQFCFENNISTFRMHNYTTIYLKHCPIVETSGVSIWLWLIVAFIVVLVAVGIFVFYRHSPVCGGKNGQRYDEPDDSNDGARIINNEYFDHGL